MDGSALKNIGQLATSSLIAKLCPFLAIPLITRLYTPDDLGRAAILMYAIAILGPLLSLRLNQAIPLTRSSYEYSALKKIIKWITNLNISVICIFGSLFLIISHPTSLNALKLLLIIFGAFLFTVNEKKQYIHSKLKNFSKISLAELFQSILGVSLKIILGFFNYGFTGLIAGSIAQISLGILLLKNKDKLEKQRFPRKYLLAILQKYRGFITLKTPAHLIFGLSAYSLPFYISFKFGDANAGLISVIYALVIVPATILSKSISKVLYIEFIDMGRNLSSYKFIKFYLRYLISIICLGILGLNFSEDIFIKVLDPRWHAGQEFLAPFLVMATFQVLGTPLMSYFDSLNDQKTPFLFHLARGITLLLMYTLCNYFALSMQWTIHFHSAIFVAFYLALIGMCGYTIRNQELAKDEKSY